MKKYIKICIVVIILFIISSLIFWLCMKILKKDNKNTYWKISQYGNNSGSQLMCYTIEGNKNGLIIVDGGFEDNEEMLTILEKIIKNHHNKVEAWILTHFDTDHAGAYMAIRDRMDNLQVDNLYVQDTPDLETCKANATWYKGWDLYERYLKLDIKEKKYLHIGDTIDNIIGLKLEVLWAYEDWIDEKMDNLLNNGSIIFKLYGNAESMLFCADAQDRQVCNYLMENYKNKLKSDYLQVPHHGNNDFSDEFYKTVNPKVAFFPAPESIMKNSESRYNAFQHSQLLEGLGAKVYYFNVSPSIVKMY